MLCYSIPIFTTISPIYLVIYILISSNVKLESNSRKQGCTGGSSMHHCYIAISTWLHESGWILACTAPRSRIPAAGVGEHFASSSLALDPASGSRLACTAPGAIQTLSGSASKKEIPQLLAMLCVCSLVPEARRQAPSFPGSCGQRVGFLPSALATLMSASLLGQKGAHTVP